MAYSRYRLEGDTRSDEVETGLQSHVADALWMLARQWQVGEFRGEDAASPVRVEYEMETTPVNQFRSYRAKSFTQIDSFTPLEAYAEQQSPADMSSFGRSAEAGMHLLRLLSGHGLEVLNNWFREQKPLKAPVRSEPGETAWVRLLLRRACDGDAIYASRARLEPAARQKLTTEQQKLLFDAAFADWQQWYAERFTSQRQFDCWDSERMEYRFQVRAGTVVLEAKEYPGGHLDWYSFDVKTESPKRPPRVQRHAPKIVLPTPVQFAGMAAQRWWEFEDSTINFGDVSSSAVDFSRMITASFATIYGDDWYVMPVRVPIGSLANVTSLKVLDSFGDVNPIASVAVQDGPKRVWRYFELMGDKADPMLFIPAMALGRLEGKALETVTLIRDETENIGWGIEKTYEGALERAVERMRQWNVSRSEVPPEAGNQWSYRLLNPVPPYWIPLVPVRMSQSIQIRLRRGRMSEWELLPDDVVGIRGQTLLPNPAAPLFIYEEEVPAGGVEITSSYQFARQQSGQSLIWFGKRKRLAGQVTPIVRETDAVRRS
jgi:hypothetical protein